MARHLQCLSHGRINAVDGVIFCLIMRRVRRLFLPVGAYIIFAQCRISVFAMAPSSL